jgi:quercetin dioxygenase-like cupin family protein
MSTSLNPGSLEPARAVRLGEWVKFAEGAIVSRVVLKSQAGNVTLFAFDAGQVLSEHTAPFDALVHVLEGRLDLTIGGKSVPVGAGEAALMPAQVPHAVAAPEKTKWLLTMIKA